MRRIGVTCALACMFVSGCDWVFAVTHVPNPPADAAEPDAAPPCQAKAVAIGRLHACALDLDGNVFCWGYNLDGLVQLGGPGRVLVPVKVALPAAADDLVAGKNDNCARVGGDVYCWGTNDVGELSCGPNDRTNAVHKIPSIPPSAQIAIGGGHVCSRSAGNGTIWCWGNNTMGQTGQATEPFVFGR